MASGFLRLRQTQELLAPAQEAPATSTKNKHESQGTDVLRGAAIFRDAQPVATSTTSPSCVMWIHLQTSICTEWEHSSMVCISAFIIGYILYLIQIPLIERISPVQGRV